MGRKQECGPRAAGGRRPHRGATLVYVTVCVPVMVGFVALSVDMGRVYVVRAELQRAADAAAHAAAWTLLNEDRMDAALRDAVFDSARSAAADIAAANTVLNAAPYVDPFADVAIGRLTQFADQTEVMSFADPAAFNAVRVTVARTAERNGPVPLFFAAFLGFPSTEVTASATAGFQDGVVGYEVTERSGNANLMPFAVQRDSWATVLSSPVDDYAYDPETGEVSAGSDGIPELNIFPGDDEWQLPPGNFGTVDIGPPNNSTADLARQIVEGVSAEDLAYFGGRLELGPGGYVDLNGDTGISAGVKDELESVKGLPRAVPLFSETWGQGNNAMFRVVGFAGIRLMHVRLTGPEHDKELIVQPAFVVDDAALTNPGAQSDYFVYRPVQIVR